MGFLNEEQLAELDKQDTADMVAREVAEAAGEGTEEAQPVEPTVDETPPETEPAAEGEAPEPKKETVEYAEEVEVSEPESEGGQPETEPLKLSDDAVIADPLNPDQTITGRELKDRMLMQSDYTRKTMELSEMRRDLESRMEAIERGVGKADEPEPQTDDDPLADYDQDDPLVKQARAMQAQIKDLSDQLGASTKTLQEIQLTNNQKALQEIESKILSDHKNLTEKDLDRASAVVEANRRIGIQLDYAEVCKEISEEKAQIAQEAVNSWKEGHLKPKVPRSDGGTAPTGTPPEKLSLDNKSIIEALDEQDRQARIAANR